MSPKFLVPSRFLFLMGSIIMCCYIIQTRRIYSSTTQLTVGSSLILAGAVCQFIFLVSGINLTNNRINFQNALLNVATVILLVWFAFKEWPGVYTLYIWGFLCIYPVLNEVVGVLNTGYARGRFHKFQI